MSKHQSTAPTASATGARAGFIHSRSHPFRNRPQLSSWLKRKKQSALSTQQSAFSHLEKHFSIAKIARAANIS
jgi:hypothetical protein